MQRRRSTLRYAARDLLGTWLLCNLLYNTDSVLRKRRAGRCCGRRSGVARAELKEKLDSVGQKVGAHLASSTTACIRNVVLQLCWLVPA